MNKGDVILLFIFVATGVFFASDLWLIMHGLDQWNSAFCTLFGVIFGGEVLAFAVYKSFKAKYVTKFDSLEYEEPKHSKREEQ